MNLKQLFTFLVQWVTAGLAIAFIFLYFLPGILPGTKPTDFDRQSWPVNVPDKAQPVTYNQAVSSSAPAVVNVYATKILNRRTHPLLQDPLFRRFFGDQGATQQRDSNLGSGVIINNDGYLITNAHVIKAADEILITLADGRQTMAEIVSLDTETDLAVLKIELIDLPSVSIGNSDSLKVGDVVLAIGNPYDFGQTVTQGIVSAVGRKRLGITTFEDFIQTDADINPGNSGGALINTKGELIGINTAIISNSGGSQGIGLAIPINLAINVMQALIEHGHVIRGWLGIEAQMVARGTTDLDGQQQTGVLVAGILQDGPAEEAGIMPGDIIIRIENTQLYDPQQAIQMISQIEPGTDIEIEILRGWEKLVLSATVTQRPSMMQ